MADGTIEVPAIPATTSATPSTAAVTKINGRVSASAMKATSSAPTEIIRAASAPTISVRRFNRST
jgi:hypothetical protein